jgi:uncharacterized protein involved in response to NO
MSFPESMDSSRRRLPRFSLFEYGFRPFFLLAGVYACLMVPIWLYIFVHHPVGFGSLPPMYWHAHEMLYGFVCAAIAGFLLTAVPSWTGARGFAGRPLYVLAFAWLAGRVAMASVGHLPLWAIALVELCFLPILAALLLPPLLRGMNRNLPMLAVLAVLWLLDAAFLFALMRGDVLLAARVLTVAIDVVLVLVTIIGGRIVPAFTANGLRRRGESVDLVTRNWVEVAVIAAMILIVLVDGFASSGRVATALAAVLALIAAALHAVRLSGWRTLKVGGESILWVLHVAYAWLPIGLALKGVHLLGGFEWAAKWQHALTAGVFGTMILAVMTRASLGHTGRPLTVAPTITAAYLLLTLAVVVRVFGGAVWPQHYVAVVDISGAAWAIAFALYLFVYAPILVGPRVDGKPG